MAVDRGTAFDENLAEIRARRLHYLVAARQPERDQWLEEFEEMAGFEDVIRKPSPRNPYQKKSRVRVKMTLTAPGCGMGDILVEDVRSKLELIPTAGAVYVEMVFDPPWNQTMMSEAARLEVGLF